MAVPGSNNRMKAAKAYMDSQEAKIILVKASTIFYPALPLPTLHYDALLPERNNETPSTHRRRKEHSATAQSRRQVQLSSLSVLSTTTLLARFQPEACPALAVVYARRCKQDLHGRR